MFSRKQKLILILTLMKIRFSFFILFFLVGVAALVLIAGDNGAQAKEWPAETFPIAELDNCDSQESCFAYCDKNENIPECVDFALKNDLISEEDAVWAKKLGGVQTGPGGCKTESACESYCDNVDNLSVCLDFAVEHDLMPPEELAEAKMVAKALAQGAKPPGGCKSKGECDNYCTQAGNMGECADFALKAGFMSQEEYGEAQQVMKALAAGAKLPGGCQNKKSCDSYCAQPDNVGECLDFALKAGFMSAEEAEEAKRIMPLMAAGKMPGNCKSKSQCEAYCNVEEHSDECAQFAIEAGFMSPEDAEMYRKTGGKGPGGCKGQEECESFCNNPQNSAACLEFGLKYGLISDEQMQEMKSGLQQTKDAIYGAPSEVSSCVKSELGGDFMSALEAGDLTAMARGDMSGIFDKCWQSYQPPQPPGVPHPDEMAPFGALPGQPIDGHMDSPMMEGQAIPGELYQQPPLEPGQPLPDEPLIIDGEEFDFGGHEDSVQPLPAIEAQPEFPELGQNEDVGGEAG